MKALLIATILTIPGQTFASNCFKQVTAIFQKAEPRMEIMGIKYNGSLKPGQGKISYQRVIVNNTSTALDMYEIESSFMATYIYVALVDKKTCKTKELIEVFFE